VLHPSYYQPGTATGEALRAHELFHIQQRGEIPGFAKKFADAAQRTHDQGLKPWENPYEIPAYEFEEAVKAYLLARGYPE
jgi:hypothetical protein